MSERSIAILAYNRQQGLDYIKNNGLNPKEHHVDLNELGDMWKRYTGFILCEGFWDNKQADAIYRRVTESVYSGKDIFADILTMDVANYRNMIVGDFAVDNDRSSILMRTPERMVEIARVDAPNVSQSSRHNVQVHDEVVLSGLPSTSSMTGVITGIGIDDNPIQACNIAIGPITPPSEQSMREILERLRVLEEERALNNRNTRNLSRHILPTDD